MLTIYNPEITEEKGNTIIRCCYETDNVKDYLWYSVPTEYREYLTNENCDAFVVGLLLYAMSNGEDIKLCSPMSEKLYYTITNYVIKALKIVNPKLKEINIIHNGLNNKQINTEAAVGTGISCGVDSFCTVYDHLRDSCPQDMKITHFTFLNAGSHGEFGGEKARRIFNERLKIIRPFAKECNKELIPIDSNINEILRMDHEKTHTIRSISCILILQKLFKYYYYSSSFRFDDFKLEEGGIMGPYDTLLVNMLCTESLTIYSTGSQYTRPEKTEKISNYEPTYRYLNVCLLENEDGHAENCSTCSKCLRTELTLDILGKLKYYDKVFSIDKYNKVRNKYIGKILLNRKDDSYSKEIYELMKKKKYNIPLSAYFFYSVKKIKKTIGYDKAS